MNLLTALSAITAILMAINLWFNAKGKIVYPLLLVVYSGYAVVELSLALRDSYQWSIILFVLLDFWAISMAIKGWIKHKNPIIKIKQ